MGVGELGWRVVEVGRGLEVRRCGAYEVDCREGFMVVCCLF